MKPLFIFATVLFWSSAFSQTPVSNDEDKKFMKSIHRFKPGHGERLDECLFTGDLMASPAAGTDIFPNFLFKILREDKIKEGYVITFLPWEEGDPKNQIYYENPIGQPKYFWLPYDVYNSSCEILVSKWNFTFGVANIPYKLRFGSGTGAGDTLDNGRQKRFFDFTSDVNLGISAGLQWKPKRDGSFSFNLVSGITITGIQLDSSNTKGFATSPSKAAAFTPYMAAVFDINKFQIGFYYGVDYIPGEIGRQWDYRDHPWFGIGLGYTLLQSEKANRGKQIN